MNWETWKFKGLRYLAVKAPSDGFHVIREDGENYGAWFSVESFRDLQAKGEPNGQLGIPGSVAWLTVRVGIKMSAGLAPKTEITPN